MARMETSPQGRPPRWLVWAMGLVAGTAGAKFSFDFGFQVAGWGFGAVTALNGGVICALLGASLAERVLRRR